VSSISEERPLRIAICLAHFHPVVAGAERQMFQLAERWARWGHEPRVFTRYVPGLPRREIVSGITIHRIIRTLPCGPLFGLSFIGSLAGQLLRFARRYDVVLDGQVPWEAVATGTVCPLLGKPSVVVPASTGPLGDIQQVFDARGSWLLRRLVCRNSRFIAISAQARRELISLGCRESAMRDVTYGVDTDQYCPAPDRADDGDGTGLAERERTVLYVARLSPVKNPYVLLRAWQRLNAEGRYRLLMAGDGPMAAELREFAEREGLKQVEFLGHVDDVAALHRRGSVYVLPSPSEGCPNALLEAMASGLCPVATRVPGIVDVVRDGVNGLLFNNDRDDELAAALARVLEDAGLRRRLAAAAREHIVAGYRLDKIARDYLALFRELVAQR
jgi:L-malate glycosyltransferase